VSELLDRIEKEIRDRLEASRAAVREHERLEAALQALGDAGLRASRAVSSRARGSSSHEVSGGARASVEKFSPKPVATAKGRGKRGAGGRAASGVGAAKRSAPEKAVTGRHRGTGRASTPAGRGAKTSSRADAPRPRKPARKRAAPGANREAVLRVVGERPGVTARELAAAAGVSGSTLYSLLRRLTQERVLEKRELPGGQTGYAIAQSRPPDGDATPTQPAVVADTPASKPADQDTTERRGGSG
jgi:hypothetical protein